MAEIIKTNIDISINTSQAYTELRNLQNQINAFNLTLNKNNKTQADMANTWSDSLSKAINQNKFFTAETVRMSTAAGALDATLRKGSTSMGQFFSAAFNKRGAMAAEVFALASERVRTMQTQFIATTNAANGMQQAIAVRPVAAFSDAASVAAEKTKILSNMFRQGTTQIINFGKNIQWAGRQLMVGFTVPLTIFGTVATKVFRELEQEVVNFRKVYGDIFTTDLEVETNLNAVRELSKEFTKYGIAAKNTMQLAAIAAQAGKQGEELQVATVQATRLATLGEIDRREAMKATIALQSAFQLSNEELANSINFLNIVENSSVVSLQNLVDAIPRVAPVIVGLGGTVKEMSVFLAAMQEGGVNAAEAANGLKSSLGRLISPTKQARDMAESFGISLNNIVQENEGNVLGMVIELSTAMEKLSDLQKQQLLSAVFGKFQFARMGALFENITREGSQAQRIIEMMDMSIEDMASTAEKELGAIEESIGTKLAGAIERLKLEIAPIGELFAKIAIPLIGLVTKVAEWFNQLSDGRKTIIAWTTLIVGGVVPALTMMTGLFFNLFGQIGRLGQAVTIFGATLMRKGPFAAIKSLTQSSKYLSLAEIDAANAAQQLGASTDIANQALTQTAVSASSARIAIDQLTASFRIYNQEQMAAAKVQKPAFGIGSVAAATAASVATKGKAPSGIKFIRRNAGGPIFTANNGNTVPGVGNADTVPALLTPGEFVINKESTKNNYSLLEAINNGQGFNKGGMIKNGILHAFGGTIVKNIFGMFRRSKPSSQIPRLPSSQADEFLGYAPKAAPAAGAISSKARWDLIKKAKNRGQNTEQIHEALKNTEHMSKFGASVGILPGKLNRAMGQGGGGASPKNLIDFYTEAQDDAFLVLKEIVKEHTGNRVNLNTTSLYNSVILRLRGINKDKKLMDKDLEDLITDALSNQPDVLEVVQELRSLEGNYRIKGPEGRSAAAVKEYEESLIKYFKEFYGFDKADDPFIIVKGGNPKKRSYDLRIKDSIDLPEGITDRFVMSISPGGTRNVPGATGIKYTDDFIDKQKQESVSRLIQNKKLEELYGRDYNLSHMNQGGVAGNPNIVPGVGNRDSVPAMLTPGEFVVNKKSTQQNYDLLKAINNGMNMGGRVKKYFGGGLIKGIAQFAGIGLAGFGGYEAGSRLSGGNMVGGIAGSLIASSVVSKIGPIIGVLGVALSSFAGVAIAVALGFVAMKKIADKVSDSGGELVKAMYGSSDRLNEFAKEFKRETVQQTLATRRAEIASNALIGDEAKQTSSQFLESKTGEQFLKDIDLAEKIGGRQERNEAILRQLMRGIISKAITEEEARAIANDIGQKLNDQSIGIKIGAQIANLTGPDGQDIAKNILEIDAIIRPTIDMQEIVRNIDKQWEELKFFEKISATIMRGGVAGGKRSMTADALAQIAMESRAATREQIDFLRLELELGLISYEEFESKKLKLFEKSSNAYTDGIKTINKTFGEGTKEAINAIKDFRKEFEKGFKTKIEILSKEDQKSINRLRDSFQQGFDPETIVSELQSRTSGMKDRGKILEEFEKVGGKDFKRIAARAGESLTDGFEIDWETVIDALEFDKNLSNRIGEKIFGADTKVAIKEKMLVALEGLDAGVLRVLGNIFDKDETISEKLLELFELDPEIFNVLTQFFDLGGNLENLFKLPNDKILEYKKSIDKLASIPAELRAGIDLDKLLLDPENLANFIKRAEEVIPLLEKIKEAGKKGTVTKVIFDSIISGDPIAQALLKNLLQDQGFKFEDLNIEAFINLTVDPDVIKAIAVLNDPKSDENQKRRAANVLIEKGSGAKKPEGGKGVIPPPGEGDKTALQKAMENLKLFREYLNARNKLLEQGLSSKALESLSQEEAIELAKKSGKELKRLIEDFNKASKQREKLELQKRALEKISMSPLQEAIEKSQELVKSYEKEINNLRKALDAAAKANELDQRRIEDRRYALGQLSKREEDINKIYDERIEALNRVSEANRRAADAQSRQIDLATALTSGDIAAAARAAQEMTGAFAEGQIESTRSQLELKREQELNSLTVEMNGQKYTRKQLELEIDEIDERVYQRNLKLRAVYDNISNYETLIKNEKEKQQEINEILEEQDKIKLKRAVETLRNEEAITKQKREQARIEARRAYNASKVLNPNSSETFNAFVKRLGLQLNTGGSVSGPGTSKSDSIPAMLSNGEYVINADTVRSLGTEFFDAINSGNVPGFKTGGRVPNKGATSSSISTRAMMAKADRGPTKKQEVGQKIIKGFQQISKGVIALSPLTMGKNNKLAKGIDNMGGIGEIFGLNSVIRLATDQGVKGDKLQAGLFPLNFVGLGAPSAAKTAGSGVAKAMATSKAAKETKQATNPGRGILGSLLDSVPGINFKNASKITKDPNHPQFTNVISRFGETIKDFYNPYKTTTQQAKDIVENLPKQKQLFKLQEMFAKGNAKGLEFNEIISQPGFRELMESTGLSQQYVVNLYAQSLPTSGISAYFASAIAKAELTAKSAQSYLKSPLTFFNRIQDRIIEARRSSRILQARRMGFSGFGSSKFLMKILDSDRLGPFKPVANLIDTKIARTRSPGVITPETTLHPMDVPLVGGRYYGPGTYSARTPELSDKMFSGFGENIHKISLTPSAVLKVLRSKGYIKIDDFVEEANKWAVKNNTSFPNLGLRGTPDIPWDHPFIQEMIKKGYLGMKHGEAFTNWLIGTPGFGLKHVGVGSARLAKRIWETQKSRFQKMVPNKFASGGAVNKYAMGGMIGFRGSREAPPPVKMAFGSIAPGMGNTDRVPALLTPGEFVVRKSVASENMGLLKALNGDIFPSIGKNDLFTEAPAIQETSSSINNLPVYNTYSINVNVPNTNASPEEIANVVASRIKRSTMSNIRTTRL